MATFSRRMQHISSAFNFKSLRTSLNPSFNSLFNDISRIPLPSVNTHQYRHIRPPSRYQAFAQYELSPNPTSVPEKVQRLHTAIKIRSPNATWRAFIAIEKAGLLSSLRAEDFSMALATFRTQNMPISDPETIQRFTSRIIIIARIMRSLGHALDVRDYNCILSLFGRAEDMHGCISLWREM